MKTLGRIVLVFAVASLMGCGSYVVPKPGSITLQNAMKSVGEGLVEMKTAQGDLRTGLIPEEVSVTFNISASGEQGGKLYVELSPIPLSSPVPGTAGSELSGKYTASRGNQITIKYKNIAFADAEKTPLKNAKAIQDILNVLKDKQNEDILNVR